MVIMQVSVQIGLSWNWSTGTELGKNESNWPFYSDFISEFCPSEENSEKSPISVKKLIHIQNKS